MAAIAASRFRLDVLQAVAGAVQRDVALRRADGEAGEARRGGRGGSGADQQHAHVARVVHDLEARQDVVAGIVAHPDDGVDVLRV